MNRLLSVWLLLSAATCLGQATSGFHRVNQVITRSNSGTYAQVVPGATVFVQNTATGAAATIYSDPLLTLTVPGAKVTTDMLGNYGYYLPLNTCVTENISSPSQGSLVIPNICGNSGLPLPLATLNGGTGTTTAPLAGQLLVGQSGSVYLPETISGDCTLANTGQIVCLKTNGVSFTSAATTAVGTSGAVIPLLSTANTWSQNQIFTGSSTTGTVLGINNTTSKNWQWVVQGSAASDAGNLDLIDSTDSTTVLSFSNTSGKLFGSPICTTGNGACATGSGTVTSFAAPSGSWPTWFVPTVTNSTTTPSLAVTVSAIPNSALANASITVNSVSCTLGSTCYISGTARTCNANGCYLILADGTIEEWGIAGPSSVGSCGGRNDCTVAVTFPYPFTSTAHLSVEVINQNNSGTGKGNMMTGLYGAATTTGFTINWVAMSFIGLTGGNLTGAETAPWFAIGN